MIEQRDSRHLDLVFGRFDLKISNFPHRNNFDLIRLFAAVQVVIVHATYHLDLKAAVSRYHNQDC